jgi:sigma-E factor negative regulatory protein RseA
MVMERISAFMDGEAAHAETQQAMLRLKQDEEHNETWATFHLIGDMMRGDPLLRGDFMARFHARMEREPTQLVPRVTWRKSANLALSAAASISAIAVVLTLALTENPLRPQGQIAAAPRSVAPVVAQAEPPVVAQAEPQARPIPASQPGKINEYLMAHQEYSPSTAFQGVAPYVRTVSESHDGNNR